MIAMESTIFTGWNYDHLFQLPEKMSANEEVNESIRPLLKISRERILRTQRLDYALVSSLERDPLLAERLKRLSTVPAWARSLR
jgi:hypothetical protein